MKAKFQVNPDCTLEVDVKDIKGCFRFIACAQEVFGIKRCGNCESTNLRLNFRKAKTADGRDCEYYSVKCNDCGYEFKFGQKHAEGAPLFPKGWEAPFEKQERKSSKPRTKPQRSEPNDYEYESSAEPEYAESASGEIPF